VIKDIEEIRYVLSETTTQLPLLKYSQLLSLINFEKKVNKKRWYFLELKDG